MKHVACLAVLVLAVTTGCFHAGMQPRTADLAQPGRVATSLDWAAYTMAPGTLTTANDRELRGVYGLRYFPPPLAMVMVVPFLSGAGHVSTGVSERLELGGTFGVQELGAEVRYALLDEDAGDSVSLTTSTGLVYRPFEMRAGHVKFARYPGGRVGLEMSRRGERVTPLANLAISYLPEHYGQLLPERLRDEATSLEDGRDEYGPPQQFLVRRDEVRLNAALGVSFPETVHRDTGRASSFHLALVPYVTLWSGAPSMDCVGCSAATPESFDSRYGVTLVGGFHWR